MKGTLGFMKSGLLAITAGAAIAVAGMGSSSTAAHARDNRPDPNGMLCFFFNSDGSVTTFDGGSIVRIDDGYGNTRTFRCNGLTGEWEEVTGLGDWGWKSVPLSAGQIATHSAGMTRR